MRRSRRRLMLREAEQKQAKIEEIPKIATPKPIPEPIVEEVSYDTKMKFGKNYYDFYDEYDTLEACEKVIQALRKDHYARKILHPNGKYLIYARKK